MTSTDTDQLPNPAPDADGWLVIDCPNFFVMPSMRYDRPFSGWTTPGKPKDSPAYWWTRGFNVHPLYRCGQDEDANAWELTENSRTHLTLETEAVSDFRKAGRTATPLKADNALAPYLA